MPPPLQPQARRGPLRIGAGVLPLAAAMLLVAIVGCGLRLWQVLAEPLWLDEAYSAFAAAHPFAWLWSVVPQYETHPPFYYALLRCWTLVAGDGMAALRLPGIVAGLLTPPLVALVAAEAGRLLGWPARRRGLLVAVAFALTCLGTPLIEMSRQARPYPLMILAYAAASLVLLRLHRRALDGRRLAGVLPAYFLLLAAMLWLHALGPLFGVAMTLALGVGVGWRGLHRRDCFALVAGHAVVALAYLPALLIVHRQAGGWVAGTWLHLDPVRVADHLQVLYAAPGWPALVAAALYAAAAFACRGALRVGAMLVLLATVPVLLSLGLSVFVTPVFILRTVAPVAAPAFVLLALGATAWAGRARLLALLMLATVAVNMAVVDVQARAEGPIEDWYGAVDWLAARARPGDVVLAYPNEGALPLRYALRDRGMVLPVLPVPAPVPAIAFPGGDYPGGTGGVPRLPPARLRALADRWAARPAPTVWLLRVSGVPYDPAEVLARTLARRRPQVSLWRYGAIRLIGFRSPSAPAPDRR